MTQPTSPGLAQVALGDLEPELALTRRMLERVPDEQLAWRPHPRSMTLGGLARHLANLLYWQQTILERDEYDMATNPTPLGEPASREELLAAFDENERELKRAAAEVDEAALLRPWTLRHGSRVVFTTPRFAALRMAGISHMVHHRAQLGVYLRLLNIAVPGMYGPTADERPPA